jgi:hypothetical protein
MRKLKSGEVKYKPSAFKEVNRLIENPLPIKEYFKGERVQVYLGHGWATGVVLHSDQSRCSVLLTKEQRVVCCTDNRNLTTAKDEKSSE